jgi:hypothetical protein
VRLRWDPRDGLVQGTMSAWMWNIRGNRKYVSKSQVYLEALGGPNLAVSKLTPYVTNNCNNNGFAWKMYAVTNTASELGQIEVRLHYAKVETTPYWEWRNLNGYYDHVAVVPVGQSAK